MKETKTSRARSETRRRRPGSRHRPSGSRKSITQACEFLAYVVQPLVQDRPHQLLRLQRPSSAAGARKEAAEVGAVALQQGEDRGSSSSRSGGRRLASSPGRGGRCPRAASPRSRARRRAPARRARASAAAPRRPAGSLRGLGRHGYRRVASVLSYQPVTRTARGADDDRPRSRPVHRARTPSSPTATTSSSRPGSSRVAGSRPTTTRPGGALVGPRGRSAFSLGTPSA
jgi:hypothetical protein